MTEQDIIAEAEHLERQIADADRELRQALQPQLSQILARLESAGAQVPQRLRRLEACLTDEAVEARFDNLPV
ncbi:hypothetical protein [Antarcticimicrobium luteum]|uniref:Uncharacterized protein n=1 Tax=Antarcticimicrobium luteum TaxID=2547397 RepID=A0A4R5UQ97_9RHOB|nr:hypothetical protein [Antarcticimicrobium luteum]TDK41219.1 hypothetical protein E1832_21250 [Antarcticimicrobium luteum]